MKRILILLIAVFMSLGLACGSVFIIDKSLSATTSQEQTESQEEDQEISATASGYWADKATSNRPSGSGTVNDPYLIGSAQTLANFAFMVNNNYKNSNTGLLYKDAYVKLTADIDISAHYWTPIGTSAYSTTDGWWIFATTTWHPYYFSGNFDGNGHTISGLTISVKGPQGVASKYLCENTFDYGDESVNFTYSNSAGIGLFGFAYNATIKDFTLKNGKINIESDVTGNASLWLHVGGAVGMLSGGNISNVSNDSVSMIYEQNRDNYYTISGSMNIGGVVGTSIDMSTISDCSCSALIDIYFYELAQFRELVVGGIVATTTYDVKECECSSDIYLNAQGSGNITSYGTAFGGIIGLLRSTRGNMWCYRNIFSGNIYYYVGPGSLINCVGGIIANLLNLSGSEYKIYECINYGKITVSNVYNTFVGGILAVNQNNSIKIYECANFGDLKLTLNSDNCTDSGYGGILGVSNTSGTYIYSSANYGNITVTSSKSIRNIGGIAGWIMDAGLITSCINHGVVTGGSNSNSIGGIAGQIGKEEKAGSWFFNLGHEDAKTNVYISNCINYSKVSGSSNYGQIVGFMNGTGKVVKCYGNNNYTSGYAPSGSAGGYSSGSLKTYSFLTKYSFYNASYNWTTSKYAGYDSISFNNEVSTSYGTSYDWLMSPLVYNYYSDSERSTRGMGSAYQNVIVPMSSVSTARIQIEWNKRGESYYLSYSDDISTISYYAWDSGTSKLVEKKVTSTSDRIPYLNGADYTLMRRYTNLFWVEYNPLHFTFSKLSIRNDGTYEQSQAYYSETVNSENRKIYVRFENNAYIDEDPIYFKFSFASIAQTVNVGVHTYKNFSLANLESNGSKGGTAQNYTNVYYLDPITITATPNLGYAVNKIVFTKDGTTTYHNFQQNNVGNLVDSSNHELSSEAAEDVVLGKVEYDFDYRFENFDVYFVPIIYEITIVSEWNPNSDFTELVSMKGTSYNGTQMVTKDYLNLGEDNKIDINYGYKYSVFINKNGETSQEHEIKENIECDYQSKKILLSSDDLINGLSTFGNDALKMTSFVIYVTRQEINYTIKINNMLNTYKSTSQHTKVDSNNFRSLMFGDISADAYKSLFGTDMLTFSDQYFAYINGTNSYTVSNSYNILYNSLSSSYSNAKIVFANSSSLPTSSALNANDKFSNLLEQYIKYHYPNSSGPMQSYELNIYVYSTLNTYKLTGEINVNNQDVGSKNVSISMTTKEDGGRVLDFYNDVGYMVSYYAPVTVSINSVPYGYKFIGWYYNNKLLSLDEEYTFINNLIVGNIGDVSIVAKFITYNTTDSSYTINPNKSVYSISSAQDLVWLSGQVAQGNTFEGITINQTANIDMSGILFNPIGSIETPFKGVYNGNNHLIENLNLGNYNISYRGLFGYVENATIKNVSLKNSSANISGYSYVGGLIGSAKNSTIENVNNLSNIQINSIKFYSIYGKEVEVYLNPDGASLSPFVYQQYIGGIVGKSENCDFVACANQGNITNTNYCEYVGGLIGFADSNTTIDQSFNSGIISSNEGQNINGLVNGTTSISDCYYINGLYVVVNGTQTGTTSKFNGNYNSNSTNLDSSIWITVNNHLALKIFYWA